MSDEPQPNSDLILYQTEDGRPVEQHFIEAIGPVKQLEKSKRGKKKKP